MKAWTVVVMVLVGVALGSRSRAVEVPVQNAGFEDPELVDGDYIYPPVDVLPHWGTGYYDHGVGADPTVWNDGNQEGDAGIWNPDAVDGFPGGAAPEGQNIGWTTSYTDWDFGFSQSLPVGLKANTEYVLSVQVGNSFYNGSAVTAPYRLELLAGGVLLDSQTGDAPGAGQWALHSMTYTTGPHPPQLNQRVEIRLVAVHYADGLGEDGYEVEFDDVSLTAETLAPLALTAITLDGENLSLRWNSKEGRLYDILAATDPAAGPPTWTALLTDIPTTPPENTRTLPLPVAPFTLISVRERPLPPLFEDDFETDKGWVTGVDGGTDTDWERGTPSAVGPPAANSPVTCYGTNIDAKYGLDVNIYLRSPSIDLSGTTSATLAFQQFFDIEVQWDAGAVRVLRAGDLTQLGADVVNPVDGTVTEWTAFSAPLPPEAMGEVVILEFRFTSDNVELVPQAGWYIDDVLLEGE